MLRFKGHSICSINNIPSFLTKYFFMIQRDGAMVSLWQDKAPGFTPGSVADPEFIYDVIIVGGGITGISTALSLQEAGKKCLVLEKENLGYGTTGGTTAHLNTLLDTPYTTIQQNFSADDAKLTADAAHEALRLIHDRINRFAISCGFKEQQAFLYAQDQEQDEQLEEIAKASAEAGLDLTYTKEIPVPIPFTKAIQVNGQASFSPLDYLYGIAKAFEQAGGTIVEHCRVTAVEEIEPLHITTDKGTFKAINLVYATHIPPGVNLLHLRCIPYRSYAIAVVLPEDEYPDGLSYDMVDPYHYFRTQEIDGRRYLIAGGKDHKTGHEENTRHCFDTLEALVRRYFNVKEIAYRWSSQYYESADGLPYIGHLPGHPQNIYVATGFGGNGMIYSSVAAITLMNLLTDQEHQYCKLFNPNRLKPVAGFTNFIQHNADVVKQFAGKIFSGEKISGWVDLAPDEAKLIKEEGHKIGLYKDQNGALHGVNPSCTHLHCDVSWNNAEQSWDCPCHGARYSMDGKVMTGPADRDLEQITLGDTDTDDKKPHQSSASSHAL